MNTRFRIFLTRWLAPALSVALLAACDGGPDAKPDGNRRGLEQRSEGRLEALRVQVDVARNRLWVLHGDGVYVYEITTRRRIGRIGMFVGEPVNCAPDLALDPSGAAIVSSNVRAVLWRLDPERFEARRQELARDTDRQKVVGFTGLAFADGLLFGVDALHGSLWKIDLAAGKAQKLALSSPVRGACGLARQKPAQAAPGRSVVLCAVGEKWTRRIEVSPDLRRGNVSDGPCS
jgi:hypothetical protein